VIAVCILFATGIYSTGQQVASIDALITTLYGRTLIGKVATVLIVGLFGLLNSMLLHPRVARPLQQLLKKPLGWTPISFKRLPQLILAELSLGLIIFLFTGLLTSASAPRGIEYTVAAEDVPDALTEIIEDVVITLYAKPNHPGQNVFTIFAASSRRPAPAEIERVLVRFTYLEQEMGKITAEAEEVEPGRYLMTGNYFSLPGRWNVEVVARREGFDDATASFEWVVLPANAHPKIISKSPLKRPLTIIATLLMITILPIAWFIWRANKQETSTETQKPETWISQLFGFEKKRGNIGVKNKNEV
jgi:copper transport protein